MFDKIVKAYDLDPMEALVAYVGPRPGFGKYLRDNVFHVTDEELQANKDRHGR